MSQQLDLLTENPSQWNAVINVTPEIQKKEIKPFVLLSLKELEGTPDSRTASLVNVDKFAAIRAVVRHCARQRSANNQPWSRSDVETFVESLRFTPECVNELTSLLCTDQIYDSLPTHLMIKPGLMKLQWKIDVSLSQAKLQSATPSSPSQDTRSLRQHTYILLILYLTNGQTVTYRITINKFHELRYVIASALKNMIVLEKRKCMRKD